MTAIPTFLFSNMEAIHQDETMELASSPYMHAEDLDLDLDAMRDHSVEPNDDTMIEDEKDHQHSAVQSMQLEPEDMNRDDDMLDEDITINDSKPPVEDLIAGANGAIQVDIAEDEDILYEEEESHNASTEEGQIQDVDLVLEETLLQGNDVEDVKIVENIPEDHEDQQAVVEEDMFSDDATNANQNAEDTHIAQREEVKIDDSKEYPPNENSQEDQDQSKTNKTLLEDDDHIDISTELQDHSGEADSSTRTKSVLGSVEEDTETPTNRDLSAEVHQPIDFPNKATNGLDEATYAENAPRDFQGENPMPHSDHEDSQSTGQPTVLHPVKVNYQDDEICLFPPTEGDTSETFFLPDDSLAYESLDKLLGACRDILAETIGNDDELVLDIASLGLHISEGSSYATQMKLSEIIEVYLALCRNEDAKQIEPLYCSLTSRVSLASQHAYLLAAASEGKTFSDVSAEHLVSTEGSPIHTVDHTEIADYQQSAINTDHDIKNISKTLDDYFQERTRTGNDFSNPTSLHSLDHIDNGEADKGEEIDEGDQENDEDNPSRIEDVDEHDEYDELESNERSTTSTVQGDEPELEDTEQIPESIPEHETQQARTEDSASVTTRINGINTNETFDSGIDNNNESVSAKFETESSRTIEGDGELYDQASFVDHASHSAQVQQVNVSEYNSEHLEFDDFEDFEEAHQDHVPNHAADLAEEPDSNHFEDSADAQPRPTKGGQLTEDVTKSITNGGMHDSDDEDDLLDYDGEDIEHEDLFDGIGDDEHHGKFEQELSAETQPQIGEFEGTEENRTSPSHEVTPPATPSMSGSSKRKTRDEEDEFNLLGSSTPDLKRRRPS